MARLLGRRAILLIQYLILCLIISDIIDVVKIIWSILEFIRNLLVVAISGYLLPVLVLDALGQKTGLLHLAVPVEGLLLLLQHRVQIIFLLEGPLVVEMFFDLALVLDRALDLLELGIRFAGHKISYGA